MAKPRKGTSAYTLENVGKVVVILLVVFALGLIVTTDPVVHDWILGLLGMYRDGPMQKPGPRDQENWFEMHYRFVDKIAAADNASSGYDLLFYGDSITECFLGTSLGEPRRRCRGVPEVFERHYNTKYRSAALAIGGDQTGHLLWRLKHGEMPTRNFPKVAVMLIGTNDIGAVRWGGRKVFNDAADIATKRLITILDLLSKRMNSTRVIVMALLPRGSSSHSFEQPSRYTAAINRFNSNVRTACRERSVVFYDCGGQFVEPDDSPTAEDGAIRINDSLMPDALHPAAQGLEAYANCLDPVIEAVLEATSSTDDTNKKSWLSAFTDRMAGNGQIR